jgi:transcriptional regulator with XRE-family HTH domain
MSNASVFAANLDRLMTMQGMRNAALAQAVNVSRQIVSQWRQGLSMPTSQDREEMIAAALGCEPDELYAEIIQETPPMLPISQWAKREGIPVGRAKSLFDLGILEGHIGGAVGEMYLVPFTARAPINSKKLVREARRPQWIAAFSVNLDLLMRQTGMSNSTMGLFTGVGGWAVINWRSGRGYPVTDRLELIAQRLECTLERLVAEPTDEQIMLWNIRYKRTAATDFAFSVNFDVLMRRDNVSNQEMAEDVDVAESTVAHWRNGRGGFPVEQLHLIAKKFGLTIEQLLVSPTEQHSKEWAFRYQQTDQDRAHAA